MTNELDLDALLALAKAADASRDEDGGFVSYGNGKFTTHSVYLSDAEVRFFDAVREAVPALIARVRELEAEKAAGFPAKLAASTLETVREAARALEREACAKAAVDAIRARRKEHDSIVELGTFGGFMLSCHVSGNGLKPLVLVSLRPENGSPTFARLDLDKHVFIDPVPEAVAVEAPGFCATIAAQIRACR